MDRFDAYGTVTACAPTFTATRQSKTKTLPFLWPPFLVCADAFRVPRIIGIHQLVYVGFVYHVYQLGQGSGVMRDVSATPARL